MSKKWKYTKREILEEILNATLRTNHLLEMLITPKSEEDDQVVDNTGLNTSESIYYYEYLQLEDFIDNFGGMARKAAVVITAFGRDLRINLEQEDSDLPIICKIAGKDSTVDQYTVNVPEELMVKFRPDGTYEVSVVPIPEPLEDDETTEGGEDSGGSNQLD